MSNIKKQRCADSVIIFLIGAAVYTIAELVWRGYTHWTMPLTGGACVLLIHRANTGLRKIPIVLRCVIGGLIISGVEFIVGCVVNLLLGWNVWDYSSMPLNLLGQICLPFSVAWVFMSLPCIVISDLIGKRRRSSPLIF